jgi:hypothetical protein
MLPGIDGARLRPDPRRSTRHCRGCRGDDVAATRSEMLMVRFDTAGIPDVCGDGPITAAGRAQVAHFGESALFCLVLD